MHWQSPLPNFFADAIAVPWTEGRKDRIDGYEHVCPASESCLCSGKVLRKTIIFKNFGFSTVDFFRAVICNHLLVITYLTCILSPIVSHLQASHAKTEVKCHTVELILEAQADSSQHFSTLHQNTGPWRRG